MNWRGLDLNLLVVFDAVVRLRSVTSAAAHLNMSQPAVSHALSRLRTALKDDLFLRKSEGLEPTPYAADLAWRVREALDALGPALQDGTAFEPAVSRRRLSIAVDNRSALVLAAPIAAAVAAGAPGVALRLVPCGTLDVPSMLDHGGLDLALSGLAAPGDRFADVPLVESGFAALVRRGHPASRDGALSSTGEETGFVDDAMAGAGMRRRTACSGPLLAAPAILLQSDMIAVMGELGAREFTRHAPLDVLDLPFPTPRVRTAMLWHRRHDEVPAHRWLRDVVSRAARTIEA